MSTLSRQAAGHVWLISRRAAKQILRLRHLVESQHTTGCCLFPATKTMKETPPQSQGMQQGNLTVTASFCRFSVRTGALESELESLRRWHLPLLDGLPKPSPRLL